MPNQLGIFDNFTKPYATIGGYQMENVQGSRYTPAPTPPDVMEKKSSNLDDNITENMVDKILPNDLGTKFKVKIEQVTKIPDYIYGGLKGDPDSNFYEFLQLCKVPYFIGGPVLTGMFAAGINNFSIASNLAAKGAAKKMALGVALYYVGAELAKSVIDVPVKFFRGVDLNHPYKDVVDLREGSPLDMPQNKKKELGHSVYESIDFTRWDLLYNNKAQKSDAINANYDKIAKKYGIKNNVNDSDATLKDKIKDTIIMSRAYKYLLSVPFVVLGLGLSKQASFSDKIGIKGTYNSFKKLFNTALPNTFLNKLTNLKDAAKSDLVRPFAEGIKDLWKGNTAASKAFGRFAILGSVLGPIIANILILAKAKVDNSKMVEVSQLNADQGGQSNG
jgi:hypothetical protein